MTILIIVPARSGSRRLPHKNITPLGSRSLIGWAAFIARQVPNSIAVASVDSKEYAQEAWYCGLQVMFRPDSLKGHDATSMALWQDQFLAAETLFEQEFDYTILLEPTCPLRTLDDVERTIAAAIIYGAACTVSKVHVPPEKYLTIGGDGLVQLDTETRSHLLPTYYLRNGAAYVCSREALFDGMPTAFPVLIDRPVISIDEPIDLKICEAIMMASLTKQAQIGGSDEGEE
jgi:CMP-N,N'-diacetyllegionaminic acid synthase